MSQRKKLSMDGNTAAAACVIRIHGSCKHLPHHAFQRNG